MDMASSPNMSADSMREWRSSEAYHEYKEYRDAQKYYGYTYQVWTRALRVITDEAHEDDREKVHSYISRHTKQEAGKAKFGSGSKAVSGHTAALRNWGYDPTGMYA